MNHCHFVRDKVYTCRTTGDWVRVRLCEEAEPLLLRVGVRPAAAAAGKAAGEQAKPVLGWARDSEAVM